MASMMASGNRCASMSAISPDPVPTSNTRMGEVVGEGRGVHAPSKQPSVPTFMAQRS